MGVCGGGGRAQQFGKPARQRRHGGVADDFVRVSSEGAARADHETAPRAGVDLPAQSAGAVPGGVAQRLALGGGEVQVDAAAPGADGMGVGGEGLAVALAEHGEHVGAVRDVVLGPSGRRCVAGVLGLVQVDDDQAGRAGGDADVEGVRRPRAGDAVRVGGGASLPVGDGRALVAGDEGKTRQPRDAASSAAVSWAEPSGYGMLGVLLFCLRMGRENRGGGRPCWGVRRRGVATGSWPKRRTAAGRSGAGRNCRGRRPGPSAGVRPWWRRPPHRW